MNIHSSCRDYLATLSSHLRYSQSIQFQCMPHINLNTEVLTKSLDMNSNRITVVIFI